MKWDFNLQLFAKNENEENEDIEIEEEEEEEIPKKKKKTSNKNKNEIGEVKEMMWEVLECLKEKKPEITEQEKQTIPIPKTPTPAQPPTLEDKVEESMKENPILKFLKALW